MREVVGAIEHVSSRSRFSHGAALSALPVRGGLNITPHRGQGQGQAWGRKGFAWGLLFFLCGSGADAGRIVPHLGLPRWWVLRAQGAGAAGPCLAQEMLWKPGHWRL